MTAADVRAPTGAVRTTLLVALAGGSGNGFGRFAFPVLLPAMKRELLSSYGSAGFVGTANVAAYLLGTIAVLVVSLRRPADQILKVGLMLSVVGMFVLATAQGLPQLALGMLCAGAGGASIFVPAPGLLRAVVPPQRRGLALGVVNAGIGLDMVLAAVLSRLFNHWWGEGSWRWVWAVMGGLSLVVLLANLLLLHPPRVVSTVRPRLSALRQAPGWLPYLAGYVLFGFGYIAFITYLPAALRDGAGFSPAHASNAFVGLGVGVTVGGVGLGRFSDRFSRKAGLLVGYSGCALCPLLLLSYREPWALGSALAFGVLFSGAVAVVATYLVDVLDPQDVSPGFAAVTIGFSLAQAIGPQLGGLLIDRTEGFGTTYLAAAAALGAAAMLTLLLPGRAARCP